MKSIEDEFLEIDRTNDWVRLFQQIKTESNNYEYTYKEAKKTENKNLNRYRDVSPYDHSRVKLLEGTCDYINASLVQVPDARRSYILAQGPLPHTTSHFWQMVWEQNSKAVLMLNKVIEKNQIKCHQYFPLSTDQEDMIFTDVGLKVEYTSEDERSFYTLRKFKLTNTKTSESRTVLHFHYTTWPDFGVPESPSAFLIFLLVVRNAGVLDENVGPPIVHCSAGIGRSGTLCLVDSCLVLIEKTRNLRSVNIKNVLMEMRKYRMGLIQTPDQLRFSYLAIIEGAKRIIAGTFAENILSNEISILNALEGKTVQERPSHQPNNVDSLGSSIPRPYQSNSRDRTRSTSPAHSHSALRERFNSSSSKRAGQDNLSGRDESPPPLPPRRPKENDNSLEASTSITPDHNNCYTHSNDSLNSLTSEISDVELRRRLRRERLAKTAERIEQIKQRQHEGEAWQKRRSKCSAEFDGTSNQNPTKRRRSINNKSSKHSQKNKR